MKFGSQFPPWENGFGEKYETILAFVVPYDLAIVVPANLNSRFKTVDEIRRR